MNLQVSWDTLGIANKSVTMEPLNIFEINFSGLKLKYYLLLAEKYKTLASLERGKHSSTFCYKILYF